MAATKKNSEFDSAKAEEFAGQLLTALNNGALCLMTSIGHRTGLFDSMANLPASTSTEIAQQAGLNERYVREWLGAMVMASVVEVDPTSTYYAGRVELHLGSAGKLPFDDATFDKAMAMNSPHLWPNPVAGLREIRRLLRAGGRIAVAFTRFSYVSAERFERHLIDTGFTDVHVHAGEPGTCAIGHS